MATNRGVSRFSKEEQIRRFLLLIDRAGDCWVWTGVRHPQTHYGVVSVDGRKMRAHRRSYELFVGPVPDGLVLDHLCRNHQCVNPAHLEPVTQRENVRRGIAGKANREKTHCARGHEFTPENTVYSTQRGNQRRQCRTCRRDACRRSEGFTGQGRWPSHNTRIG